MPEFSLPSHSYTPQLGWSSTRSETYRTCRRRYFFQYYGKYDSQVPVERIQQLKALSSIPMTIGLAVHEVLAVLLKRLLQTCSPIDRQRFDRHVEQTVEKLLSYTAFMEVVYGERRAPDQGELMAPVMACLEQFLNSERYGWFQQHLPNDPLGLIEPPGYGEARLQGMKIFAKVDCLFQVNGETLIVDWKTGRQDPAKHIRQLLGYAAWAEDCLAIPASEITCVAAYFKPEYQEIEKRPTEAELQGLAIEVAADIQEMQNLCTDPQRNIPLPKDHFPLTDNLSYCQNCCYRELCDRGVGKKE